jgi:probable O-glycosylation ligase (exosortase A-associated)
MYFCAVSSLISVVGSYSRGGFVGMAAICIVLLWRSKNKLAIGTVAVLAIVIGASFVPQKWVDRMKTIQNFEEDKSASGRLELWGHAIRIANDDPITGGGFGAFEHLPTYKRLSPEIVTKRNVHSIYFEMLGTQGYVGLLIFLALGIAGFTAAGKIRRQTEGIPGLENEFKFANMMQISLVAYAVSGAFLNLSTYDLYYALLAMITMQRKLLDKKLANGLASPEQSEAGQALISGATTPTHAPHMPGRSFLRPRAARG